MQVQFAKKRVKAKNLLVANLLVHEIKQRFRILHVRAQKFEPAPPLLEEAYLRPYTPLVRSSRSFLQERLVIESTSLFHGDQKVLINFSCESTILTTLQLKFLALDYLEHICLLLCEILEYIYSHTSLRYKFLHPYNHERTYYLWGNV